jgi:chorismate-pyruvate lyase
MMTIAFEYLLAGAVQLDVTVALQADGEPDWILARSNGQPLNLEGIWVDDEQLGTWPLFHVLADKARKELCK